MQDAPKGKKLAIIAGAGPAGLTAAYELLHRTDIIPLILEKSADIGGISRTVKYKGNRIDIGGHRFFSKSERVMDWWLKILPRAIPGEGETEGQMLVRRRLSRIYFLRRFFRYPVTLSRDTLCKLGLVRSAAIFFSYLRIRIRPLREERNLEDFLINRFGRNLYHTFFEAYTEKVWGIPCREIDPEWGAQRIKGLSVSGTLRHAIRQIFRIRSADPDIRQSNTETSLIDTFLYPRYGPGQLWEEVARQVRESGGTILMEQEVTGIRTEGDHVTSVSVKDLSTGMTRSMDCDYFFSTMPVQELVQRICPFLPDPIRAIADGLLYRDFITVGLLLRPQEAGKKPGKGKYDLGAIRDNWIYIQEKDVQVGRLQIFNNWSPSMVARPGDSIWVGMEYFCQEGDALWRMADSEMIRLAGRELCAIGLTGENDVIDGTVIRVEKAYPAYFGTYHQFGLIRERLSLFGNLFMIGRNGMHKYNNADHSMLTAMTAVDNILAGRKDHANIWSVNTEQSYHEAKS